jgi:hypothetical protein
VDRWVVHEMVVVKDETQGTTLVTLQGNGGQIVDQGSQDSLSRRRLGGLKRVQQVRPCERDIEFGGQE